MQYLVGDIVIRHNQLQDTIVDLCHSAHLRVGIEAGIGLTPDLSLFRAVDILVKMVSSCF